MSAFPETLSPSEAKRAESELDSTSRWKKHFTGQRLDVLDTVGKWCDATVAEV